MVQSHFPSYWSLSIRTPFASLASSMKCVTHSQKAEANCARGKRVLFEQTVLTAWTERMLPR